MSKILKGNTAWRSAAVPFGPALAAMLAVSCLALSAPARADDRGHQNDHGHHDNHGNDRDHGHDHGRPPPHGPYGPGAHGPQGPRWAKGDHLPPEYRGRQYIVENWRGYRLAAPPRGYQWVEIGPDFVLSAISSGVVLQVVLGQ
jgi:Ni/Co efflux regulator RcnB